MEASDNDSGENAQLVYGIYHVSNNGANKFKIDAKTGEIGITHLNNLLSIEI